MSVAKTDVLLHDPTGQEYGYIFGIREERLQSWRTRTIDQIEQQMPNDSGTRDSSEDE